MLKRTLLWVIPIVAMALIAAYVVLSPMVAIHASGWNGM